jgi:hypothetical protein
MEGGDDIAAAPPRNGNSRCARAKCARRRRAGVDRRHRVRAAALASSKRRVTVLSKRSRCSGRHGDGPRPSTVFPQERGVLVHAAMAAFWGSAKRHDMPLAMSRETPSAHGEQAAADALAALRRSLARHAAVWAESGRGSKTCRNVGRRI